MMHLDDTQKKEVAAWLAAGLKLSEIQSRLASQFGLKLTYMDVRLLVDDLKLMPKDVEPAKPAGPLGGETVAAPEPTRLAKSVAAQPEPVEPQRGAGGVSVTVDEIAKPGAMISGKVTFSDGQSGEWYLDELNRLGIVPKQQGYRPSAADVQQFQMALQDALSKY